jgi:hypothetical protein
MNQSTEVLPKAEGAATPSLTAQVFEDVGRGEDDEVNSTSKAKSEPIILFKDGDPSFDEALMELHRNYLTGIIQKDIELLKPLFSNACAFRESAPVSGNDIVNGVINAIYHNEPDNFNDASQLFEVIGSDVRCTFVEFLWAGSGYLHYYFLFREDRELAYQETRFLGYDDEGNVQLSLFFIVTEPDREGAVFHNMTIGNINGDYKIVFAENNI